MPYSSIYGGLYKKISHAMHRHIHKHAHHVTHSIAYHFETLYVTIVMSFFSIAFLGNALFAATSPKLKSNETLIYPLNQVSTFACRQLMKPWAELDKNCKVPLPIVKGANYAKYKDDNEYGNIYTVLWGATYTDGRDLTKGDHAGIDIASASGTPLYAIAHGIVTFAGTQAGYGNVVKIMFRYKDVNYHAVYGHMNSISVKQGDIVEQGQMIGELGNSGETFGALGGNHVHFEIDKDNGGKPAFYYQGCPALATKSFTQITNGGLCREYREKYSYDPIAFIEASKVGTVVALSDSHPVASVDTPAVVQSLETLSSSVLPLLSIKDYKLTKDALLFLQDQDIKITVDYNKKMNLGQSGIITIYITEKGSDKKFNGTLPAMLSIVSSNPGIELEQEILQYMTQGIQKIGFTTKKLGQTTVAFSLGGQTLASFNVETIQ